MCALAIDPKNTSIIYAQTDDSIYKSTDWGGHWSKLTQDYPGVVGYSLAIAPSNPSILYSGTNHGVSKTEDGGGAWSHGQGPTDPYALAIDSLNASTVFAGTGAGVFKSTDGGLTGVPSARLILMFLPWPLIPQPPASSMQGLMVTGCLRAPMGE